MEWPLRRGKFVASSEARENWPRLIYAYLEAKLRVQNTEYPRDIGALRKDDFYDLPGGGSFRGKCM